MGVVSRKWMWVESMGVASGCGCKEVPYSGKFSHGANFRIFRMKASVRGKKKSEIYANASTRTYVSTRGLN